MIILDVLNRNITRIIHLWINSWNIEIVHCLTFFDITEINIIDFTFILF